MEIFIQAQFEDYNPGKASQKALRTVSNIFLRNEVPSVCQNPDAQNNIYGLFFILIAIPWAQYNIAITE